MVALPILLVVLGCMVCTAWAGKTFYNFQAWQSAGFNPVPSDFPENQAILTAKTSGLALSGGGVNAYASAMGLFSALDFSGYMVSSKTSPYSFNLPPFILQLFSPFCSPFCSPLFLKNLLLNKKKLE